MSTDGSTGGGQQSTGGQSTGAAAFGGWGDNWRQGMAAGSTDAEKELAQLGRYESPDQIWKKTRELEKRFSSGEVRSALKKDATPEETARWRTENGVPAKPEDYKLTLPEGKAPPKEDDAFLAAFRKSAHESHYTQGQMDAAVASFYTEVDRLSTTASASEAKAIKEADAQLRQEWGVDYELNKNLEDSLLARAPAGFREKFLKGFLEDHTPIQASVEAHKWLVQLEREINPAATVVSGQSTNLGQTIETELATIKKHIANHGQPPYYKGPESEAMQARYLKLLDAQAGLQKKEKQAA